MMTLGIRHRNEGAMWDDKKRQRFEELRTPGRDLSNVEESELAAMVSELENMEAAYLKAANERLRRENELAERRHAQLQNLVERKEALAQRLAGVVVEAQAERRAIECELATVLSEDRDSED
jgi:hypothetical protein